MRQGTRGQYTGLITRTCILCPKPVRCATVALYSTRLFQQLVVIILDG